MVCVRAMIFMRELCDINTTFWAKTITTVALCTSKGTGMIVRLCSAVHDFVIFDMVVLISAVNIGCFHC